MFAMLLGGAGNQGLRYHVNALQNFRARHKPHNVCPCVYAYWFRQTIAESRNHCEDVAELRDGHAVDRKMWPEDSIEKREDFLAQCHRA